MNSGDQPSIPVQEQASVLEDLGSHSIYWVVLHTPSSFANLSFSVYNFKNSISPPNVAVKTEQKLEAEHLSPPGREAASQTH